jgi:phage terminase Nu1 subunit (DNA packaging protein)
MTDLVKTLRRSYWIGDNVTTAALAEEAADEIERLERIAEWRLGLVNAGVDILREIRTLCDRVDTETNEALQQSLVNDIYNVLDAAPRPSRSSEGSADE